MGEGGGGGREKEGEKGERREGGEMGRTPPPPYSPNLASSLLNFSTWAQPLAAPDHGGSSTPGPSNHCSISIKQILAQPLCLTSSTSTGRRLDLLRLPQQPVFAKISKPGDTRANDTRGAGEGCCPSNPPTPPRPRLACSIRSACSDPEAGKQRCALASPPWAWLCSFGPTQEFPTIRMLWTLLPSSLG